MYDLITTKNINLIIEEAWNKRAAHGDKINDFGLNEQEIIHLMARELQPSSFRLWRGKIRGDKLKYFKRKKNID